MKKIIKALYKIFVLKFNVKINQIYKTKIDNINFKFKDSIISRIVKSVSKEINNGNIYDFKYIDFKEGDVVIDIGANIGVVSIYLAKKYPFLKIYAYEPVVENYNNFIENIKLNKVPEGRIYAFNMAVTSDERDITMNINVLNSGGSSVENIVAIGAKPDNNNIKSISLENILNTNNIKKVKLLKIDCEGSEYEIIKNTNPDKLKDIIMIRGEFHENKTLTQEYDAEELLKYTKQYIKDCQILISKDCFIM